MPRSRSPLWAVPFWTNALPERWACVGPRLCMDAPLGKLVHFIRHLPALSVNEIKEMEKMNPKSVADLDEERQKEEFLKGRSPVEAPKQHKHH